MKNYYILFVFVLFFSFAQSQNVSVQTQGQSGISKSSGREHLLMDFGWKFSFGHPYDTDKDFGSGTGYFSYFAKSSYGDGAASLLFDDRSWRALDLPHDWAVEQEFSSNASFSHGFKAIGRKFPERSVGWYRKTFAVPASDLGRRIAIEFDGVFRNSLVWVNGHLLGNELSGYNSFQYDLTDYLNYGGKNVIAVRVDATMEEGWFYEGAGIYRHVWLTKTNPLHVAWNGTFVNSNVVGKNAQVNVSTTIVNKGSTPRTFSVTHSIVNAEGKETTMSRKDKIILKPFEQRDVLSNVNIPNVSLWDIDSPYLYKLFTSVIENGLEIDQYVTPFGVRTIRFDAKEGFFLNGRNVKLKGTNNHQDHAGVGSALPDELQYYRIKLLKEMGSNAYRCSHNPPTPEMLNACDQLGMLVIDENRLMGTNFQMEKDMKSLILRDRNHPSIITWSIGNEEWGIENSQTGARIATSMQAYAKSLDSTRYITAAVSGGFGSGISDVIDVMGYNYMGNGDIDGHYKRFPNQPGMGTEEGSTFATRGIYMKELGKNYAPAYDSKPRPSFYSIEEGWNFYNDRPHFAGVFFWTGFDYRGEPTPFGWPSVTSYFGMMDLCGFPKDNVYYLRSWWGDQPTLHLFPHWNWKGSEGKEIDVWVHSNCDEVELFLNKESQGRKTMKRNSHLEWKVKYKVGVLEAIGYKNGKKVMSDLEKTTDEPNVINLSSHKLLLKADGEDLVMITVGVNDKSGLRVPTASNDITFSITGPGRIIGVGNGDPVSLEKEKFVEEIVSLPLTDLMEKRLEGLDNDVKEYSKPTDKDWVEAFKHRDYKNYASAYIHRGYFELSDKFPTSKVTYFYKSVGELQHIYVNGMEVGNNLKYNEEGNAFVLDSKILKTGRNQIDIIATPLKKKYEWDNVNTHPGVVQVYTPSKSYSRKLFSGYAQVIVQGTKVPGEITLTASGEKLKTSTIKIKSTETVPRACVE
jgi:beta-galactosidase